MIRPPQQDDGDEEWKDLALASQNVDKDNIRTSSKENNEENRIRICSQPFLPSAV